MKVAEVTRQLVTSGEGAFQALQDFVVVRMTMDSMTPGGIVVPLSMDEPGVEPYQGVVELVGPGAESEWNGNYTTPPCEVGDQVLIVLWANAVQPRARFRHDESDYWIIRFHDIMGVFPG